MAQSTAVAGPLSEPSPPAPHPTLLTVEQAAERLNVSSNYVRRRLIFEKRIPYVKIGRHVRIESQAVDDLIEKGRVEVEEPASLAALPRRALADIRREQVSRWRTSESTP